MLQVKVRMQADVAGTRYASTFAAFCEIMRAEGLRGMWRGAGPTCTRAAVGAMTELPVYDEIKTRLLDHNVLEDGFQVHIIRCAFDGWVSKQLHAVVVFSLATV